MSFDLFNHLRKIVSSSELVADPLHREIGLAAISAVAKLLPGVTPDDECLGNVLAAITCQSSYVASTGSELLRLLAVHHEPARQLIFRLLQSESEDDRYWAIACVGFRERVLTDALTVKILRRGLADKSLKLRMSSADSAARLGIREVLPELQTMRESFTNPDDLASADLCIDLVRDGYSIEVLSAESLVGVSDCNGPLVGTWCHMTVRTDEGEFVGSFVSQLEINKKGAPAAAKRVVEQYLHGSTQR